MTSVNWHLYPNEKPEEEKDYLVFIRGFDNHCPYYDESGIDRAPEYCRYEPCEDCVHNEYVFYTEMRVCMYFGGEWSLLENDLGEKVLAWTELPSPPDLEKQ